MKPTLTGFVIRLRKKRKLLRTSLKSPGKKKMIQRLLNKYLFVISRFTFVVKKENEESIAKLLALAAKIREEKFQFRSTLKENQALLRKSTEFPLIEQQYERKISEQLVLQNALNNKLIMMVNERTRIKDNIAVEVNALKTKKEQLEEATKRVQEDCANSDKMKDVVAATKEKIKANKEKLERIKFGDKVKLMTILSRGTESELSMQKQLEDLAVFAWNKRNSVQKLSQKMSQKNAETLDRCAEAIGKLGEEELGNEELLGPEFVAKAVEIAKNVRKEINRKNKVTQSLDCIVKKSMERLNPNKPSGNRPIIRSQLTSRPKVETRPEYSQNESLYQFRVKDWLTKI